MGALRTLGYEYAWWRGDPLPVLTPNAQLQIAPSDQIALLAGLTGLAAAEVRHRLLEAHRPYVARMAGTPVAYGWVASATGGIRELNLSYQIGPRHRYLWDFATFPAWRGQGIYPRLLQAIVAAEDADRFWIGHAADNHASARGMAKAGFQRYGALASWPDGRLTIVPHNDPQRAAVSPMGALLGLTLATDTGE